MSGVSPTAHALRQIVNYHDKAGKPITNPRQYNEMLEYSGTKTDINPFADFRATLNVNLQGERGSALFWMLFSQTRNDFDVSNVKLGLTPSCPMPLRLQIIAQHDYRANENRRLDEKPAANHSYVRITNLMAATLGLALSLTYRVIRAVLRVLAAVVTIPYAYYQQKAYGVEGWAKEDLNRIVWEWIDVATTAYSIVGLVNMFHPNAVKLDWLRDYYVERTDEAIVRNQEFAAAKKAYLDREAEARENAGKGQAQGVDYRNTEWMELREIRSTQSSKESDHASSEDESDSEKISSISKKRVYQG